MHQLFIDADVLAYESAFGAQKTYYEYLGNTFPDAKSCEEFCKTHKHDYRALRKAGKITSRVEIMDQAVARQKLLTKIDNICDAAGSKKYTLVLSGDGNFRDEHAVTQPYKANRPEKPQHYEYIRGCILDMGAELTVGIEADDWLGIAMEETPLAVICTVDKDLNMIPGRHYDWNKGLRYKVDAPNAARWFFRQLLTGDSTDTIPGLPGWGEVRANKLLDPIRDDISAMWAAIKAEYAKAPFTFKNGTKTTDNAGDYLTEQGRLLWIQRRPDELWDPDYYQQEYVNVHSR